MDIIVNNKLDYKDYIASQIKQSVQTRQYDVYKKRSKNAIRISAQDWQPGSKVLEIGCGDGFGMDHIRKLNFEVIGVDINPEKIKIAKQQGHEAYCCDALKLPFDDRSFDVVYCRHSLEHFLKPCEVLKEINRVLKNRGLLTIITPIVMSNKLNSKHVHAIPDQEYVSKLLRAERFTITRNETKDMEGGLEVWTLAKKNIILTCSSKRSLSGLSRIVTLLNPAFNIDRVFGFQEAIKKKEEYDYFFFHNVTNISVELRNQAIIYGLKSIVVAFNKDKKLLESYKKYPPLAILVNSASAKQELDRIGISSIRLYRPNKLIIPPVYIPKTKKRRVLWYLKDNDPVYEQHHKIIRKVVNKLKDVEFLFFPAKKSIIKTDNVRMLGKIKINRYINKTQGMIRISDKLDMGRAVFDIIANGRWVISWQNDEPFVYTVTELNQIIDAISFHLDNWTDEDGLKLYNYIKQTFNEDILQQRWIDQVRGVFKI